MYINLANIDFGGEGGGKKAVLQETTIESLLTETTKVVTPPEGVDGFNKVTVTHAPVETLTEATITSNGETTITPSSGFDATFGVKVVTNVTTPLETWTDVDGMKYAYSGISKFQDGYKLAPRTGDNCRYMFSSAKLTEIPEFTTTSLTSTNNMFERCRLISRVHLFDTAGVTDMGYMFSYCSQLAVVPLFDTSNVTNMSNMFSHCEQLTSVPLFDTSKVTNMNNMFSYCGKLTSVPLFDTSNVTNMSNMLADCSALTTLGGFTGLKVNLYLSYSPLLTHDSLLNVINEAADVTASPKTLTLGATNLAKLTDEEKAIATSKGWTLK